MKKDKIKIIHNLEDSSIIDELIKKSSEKRSWMDNRVFSIDSIKKANSIGFILYNNFDLSVTWEGGKDADSTIIMYDDEEELNPKIESKLGNGVITLTYPFSFDLPNDLDLIIINAPNYITPTITVLSEVLDIDKNKKTFSINLKMQIPDIKIEMPKGFPIAGLMLVKKGLYDEYELSQE
jgi:hypothetical protein